MEYAEKGDLVSLIEEKGNFTENEAKKIADKIFGNLPQGKKAKDNVLDIDPTLDNNIRNYYLEGPQSYIVFALPNVSDNSETFEDVP